MNNFNKVKLLTALALSIFSFTIISGASPQILAKEGVKMTEGTRLLYEVRSEGNTYNFDVNLNHFGDYISFDFNMGTNSGVVFIEEVAMENATDLYNYFGEGYEELIEKTAVWVSKKLFNDLKAGKSVNIGLGNYTSEREIFTLVGTETYSFSVKGDGVPFNIPVIVIATKDSEKVIWIANDPNNRLIVMMDIDFRIDLVGYESLE